jgi:hypothetical protein
MNHYIVLSQLQLTLLSVLVSLLTTFGITINTYYSEYQKLPVVHIDKTGSCIKVVNFENGHAFNCADVNVLLRKYRVANEKVPTSFLQYMQQNNR